MTTFFDLYNYWIFIFLMIVGFYIVISQGNLVKKLVGLALFLPILKPYSRLLGRRFAEEQDRPDLSLQSVDVPDAALAASAGLLGHMRLETAALTLHIFHLRPEQLALSREVAQPLAARDRHG